MKAFKRTDKTYLEDNQALSDLIKELIQNVADDQTELYEGAEVEPIECQSRDGFWAASHNCGGFEYKGFTDVRMIVGSGTYPTSKEARKQIKKAYEQNERYAREAMEEQFKALNIPKDKQNYHDLYELGHGKLAETFDEKTSEMCSDDTIMYEIRIMYGGVDEKGEHTAWVSAAVNWESPYHRSSISWMPGFKCEDSSEVEVNWKTDKQAKARLTKALAKVVGKVF